MCSVPESSKLKDGCKIENDVNVPAVLSMWQNLYLAAPKVYIPFTKFDIGFSILSSVAIASIRFTAELFFETYLQWPAESAKKTYASACFASICHSLLLVPSLCIAMYHQPYSMTAKLSDAPQWWQDASVALLQLCSGYMIYDAFFMFYDNNWSLDPDDAPFLGHHIATVVYMSQARVLGAGHISAMALMCSGEVTNPFQNSLNITRFAIQLDPAGSWSHLVHPYVELAYAVTYGFVRSIIGPIQILHITYELLLTKQGRQNIPLYVSLLWVFIIWTIIWGSVPWTIEAIEMAKDGLTVKYDVDWDYGPRFEL